jgi:hypothetical protein
VRDLGFTRWWRFGSWSSWLWRFPSIFPEDGVSMALRMMVSYHITIRRHNQGDHDFNSCLQFTAFKIRPTTAFAVPLHCHAPNIIQDIGYVLKPHSSEAFRLKATSTHPRLISLPLISAYHTHIFMRIAFGKWGGGGRSNQYVTSRHYKLGCVE